MKIRYRDCNDADIPPGYFKECVYPASVARGSIIRDVRVLMDDNLSAEQFQNRIAWYMQYIAPCIDKDEFTRKEQP